MKTQVVKQAMHIFEELFELDGAARSEAIQKACSGDEALRREVERLLANAKGIEIVESEPSIDDSDTVFALNSIDRYELLEEIGRGGMGTVHRAIDGQLDREVAIKVMRDSSASGDALRRFSAEAMIAARLQHPGIAPVYDSGLLVDGRPFLAMKLVNGKTLTSMLSERSSPMDGQPKLLAAFEDLCQVIAYAHSHGIIHRDLKPDNVMVGNFGEVQVMDWGLAKHLDEHEQPADEKGDQQSSLSPTGRRSGSDTRLGTVMGTPAYMPPEQMAGIRCTRTDVFSLGAILCEILTGRPPYAADSADEVFTKSAKADLDEANRRLDECGADVELVQLARQCLLADRDQRPADGAEVASRMSAYSQTVQARLRKAEIEKARSEAEAIEANKRRRVTALLMMTALMLVVVVFGGWVWVSQRETERTRQQSVRLAVAAEQLKQARDETIRLSQVARDAPIDDPAAWDAAQVAANQAKAMISTGDVPLELADDIGRVAEEIAIQTADRRFLAAIERAREESLKQISVPGKPEPSAQQRRCEQLSDVFRDTPLHPASRDKRAAREYLGSRDVSVTEALIGAIDEWIVFSNSQSDRQWLAETVAPVDKNKWRKTCRAAMVNVDEEVLLGLLDDEETFGQSPRSVINLCWSVNESFPMVSTLRVLRRVSKHHPGDFWLNCALGDQAMKLGSTHPASQYYQNALNVKQLSHLHREIAVGALSENFPQYAQQHLQQALELNDRSGLSWELLAVTHLKIDRLEGVNSLDQAELAYNQADALCAGNLSRPADYADFLDRSGKKQKAIEYLRRSVTERRDDTGQLHRMLINLFYSDQQYRETTKEFRSYIQRQFADSMLCVTVSHAAIKASDRLGKDAQKVTSEQQRELCEEAHQCLRFSLDMWLSRQTGWPVLRKILALRDAGDYNRVYLSDSIAQLPSQQQNDWQKLWSDVEAEERKLNAFEASTYDMKQWTILDPQSVASEAGATFQKLPDKSFLVEGERQERDVYTVTSDIDLQGIHAIRLDVIADDRMPKRGPGRNEHGNFHLAEIQMWIPDESSEDGLRQVPFNHAIATHSWRERPVANAIDGNANTLWHVWGKVGVSHTAKLYLDHPIAQSVGTRLVIRLIHGGDRVNAPIGRFRLSYQRAKTEDSR